MAGAIPMLQREQRRHLLMNGWLIAGFIVVGTAVTNERGIFRPLGFDGALSATARAFIAIAAPAGLDAPRLRDVRSVSSLSPFEVTAPSRDLRRRLIDAMDWEEGDGDGNAPREPLGIGNGGGTGADTPVTVAQVDPSTLPPAFPTPPSVLGPTALNLPSPAPDVIPPSAVPEPGTWALLIAGFGLLGGTLRVLDRRRRALDAPVRRRRKSRTAAL